MSGISFEEEQTNFLAEMNPFNIKGRYPEFWGSVPLKQEAEELARRTEAMLQWLKSQL